MAEVNAGRLQGEQLLFESSLVLQELFGVKSFIDRKSHGLILALYYRYIFINDIF